MSCRREPGREIRPGVRRLIRPVPRRGTGLREETDEEIRLHIELRTEELVRRGWEREAARAEALRRFGSMNRARPTLLRAAHERERTMRVREWWEGMRLDARLAFRRLFARPGFTAGAVVTLALGVGANAALFSVVRHSLLDPLPFPEPDRLVRVVERTGPDGPGNVSLPNVEDLRERNRTLERLGRFQFSRVRARFGDASELLLAVLVEPEVFELLGREPLFGRLPSGGEEDVVAVSHRLWLSRLGGDPGAIGRSLELEGEPYVVVGVMPPDFAFTGSDVALYAALPPPAAYMRNRRVHVSGALARVRTGVSPKEVSEDLARVSEAIAADHPGEDPGHAMEAQPLREALTGSSRTPLMLLAGAVLLVLLVACANIAGLQIARAASREREMGVRLALGAGRGTLLRQLLVENLLLFALGAAVSVPVAVAGVEWLVANAPGGLPRTAEISLDGTVLALAFALAAGLGILAGLGPALHAARARAPGALSTRLDKASPRPSAQRLRSALVVGQLALSVALLAGAGLLVRSLQELQGVDPGFRPEDLAVIRVSLPDGYAGEQVPAFYRRMPDVLAALPGVETVSATSALPVSGGDGRGEVAVEGRPFDPGSAPGATFRRVLPGFFGVMGIPLVAGREFTDRDGEGEPVVIINATMAERLFPGGDALGQRIRIGPSEDEPWLTVVGVVGDVRNETLEEVDAFATYEPHAQRPRTSMYVVARGRGDASDLVAPVRRALLRLEPGLYVYEAGTMESRMAATTAPRRFNTLLLGGFALVALLLGAVGVYGLTAYGVAQRRREIGIRLALGASYGQVLGLLVGGTIRLAAVGLVVGLAAAAGLVRLLRGLLFGVSPLDPVTLAGIVVLLGGVTVLAAWLPARRARNVPAAAALAEG